MRSIQLRAVTTAAALSLLASSFSFPDSALGEAPGWAWPVTGPVITHYRNGADPYAAGEHRGIDIAAPVATPVAAATSGTVTYAGVAGSSGLTVAVRTTDGLLETTYLHLSSTAVHRGDAVSTGDRIGAVGTTGRRSVAEPHLHFGVRDAGDRFGYHDPLGFLPAPPVDPGLRVPDPIALPVTSPVAPDPVPEPVSAPAAPLVVTGTPVALGPAAATVASASANTAAAPAPLSLDGAPQPVAVTRVAPPSSARGPVPGSRARASSAGASGARSGAPAATPAARRASAAHGNPFDALQHRSAVVHRRSGAPSPMGAPHTTEARTASAVATHLANRRDMHGAAPGRHGETDTGWLVACAALVLAAVALGKPKGPVAAARECRRLADSIAAWAITSRRRSITSTRSPISGTRTRRSRPTFSPGTCASAARTSSS